MCSHSLYAGYNNRGTVITVTGVEEFIRVEFLCFRNRGIIIHRCLCGSGSSINFDYLSGSNQDLNADSGARFLQNKTIQITCNFLKLGLTFNKNTSIFNNFCRNFTIGIRI